MRGAMPDYSPDASISRFRTSVQDPPRRAGAPTGGAHASRRPAPGRLPPSSHGMACTGPLIPGNLSRFEPALQARLHALYGRIEQGGMLRRARCCARRCGRSPRSGTQTRHSGFRILQGRCRLRCRSRAGCGAGCPAGGGARRAGKGAPGASNPVPPSRRRDRAADSGPPAPGGTAAAVGSPGGVSERPTQAPVLRLADRGRPLPPPPEPRGLSCGSRCASRAGQPPKRQPRAAVPRHRPLLGSHAPRKNHVNPSGVQGAPSRAARCGVSGPFRAELCEAGPASPI